MKQGRRRTCGWSLPITFLAAICLVFLPSPASSHAAASCRPPRGPGDNLVHSSDLRARGVACRVARRVVLASTKGPRGRFSEGTPFTVARQRWRCHASPSPGSHQRCTSSARAVVTIVWGD